METVNVETLKMNPPKFSNKTVLLYAPDMKYLAEGIARKMEIPVDVCNERFGYFEDGEERLILEIDSKADLQGKDIVYVADLRTMADFAIHGSNITWLGWQGCRSIVVVVPWLGFSTMERSGFDGEVATLQPLLARFSQPIEPAIPTHYVFCHLHTPTIIPMLKGGVGHDLMSFYPTFWTHVIRGIIEAKGYKNPVISSADRGQLSLVTRIANSLKLNMVAITKMRNPKTSELQVVSVDGKPFIKHANVFIVDDMTRSAGTLVKAAAELGDRDGEPGATSITAIVTHGAFCKGNFQEIMDFVDSSNISEIYITNTHPMSQRVLTNPKFHVIDISSLYAQVISRLLRSQ